MAIPDDMTKLLHAWQAGDDDAGHQLFSDLYELLRQRARQRLRQEPGSPTYQTGDLVQDLYLELDKQRVSWADRAHFFIFVALKLRHLLVDRARRKKRVRHGGLLQKVDLSEAFEVAGGQLDYLPLLDEALKKLEKAHPRPYQVFLLYYFNNLNTKQIAQVLEVSPSTSERALNFAQTWLTRETADALPPQ
jgi:RNA polymerase sigma factor (TIGR02999 family)